LRPQIICFLEELSSQHLVKLSTYYLSIKYVDEVFTSADFKNDEIQLIVLTCFSLSVKFEEHADHILPIRYISEYLNFKFSLSQITDAEKIIFKILNYSLRRETPISFIELYMFCDTEKNLPPAYKKAVIETASLARHDFNSNYNEPSKIAAASLFCVRLAFQLTPWTFSLSRLTGLTVEQFQKSIVLMHRLFAKHFYDPLNYQNTLFDKSSHAKIVSIDEQSRTHPDISTTKEEDIKIKLNSVQPNPYNFKITLHPVPFTKEFTN
jgi:hypothetical protein